MARAKWREIFLRQFEQPDRRSQTPAMLWVSWVFEILLKMYKRSRGLNQSFEEIIILRVAIEPEMFQDIVSFVIKPLIPAPEIRAIKRMLGDLAREFGIVTFEIANKL